MPWLWVTTYLKNGYLILGRPSIRLGMLIYVLLEAITDTKGLLGISLLNM
jgi:hypothetical protein